MVSLCDGCERFFEGELKRFNAKKLKPSICNVPYEESESCGNIECYYNLEAECCVDFQFCEKCFSNKQVIDATFVSFVKIWADGKGNKANSADAKKRHGWFPTFECPFFRICPSLNDWSWSVADSQVAGRERPVMLHSCPSLVVCVGQELAESCPSYSGASHKLNV